MTGGGLELARQYSAEVIEPLLGGLPGAPSRYRAARLWVRRARARRRHLARPRLGTAAHRAGPRERRRARGRPARGRAARGVARAPDRFATTWDPVVRQRAEVSSPLAFARSRTGLTLDRAPTTVEWLSLTGQAVRDSSVPVFRDDTGSSRPSATGSPGTPTTSGASPRLRTGPASASSCPSSASWRTAATTPARG